MPLSANWRFHLDMSEVGSNVFGGPNFAGAIDIVKSLAHGTTLDKFDLGYIAERTVASGSNDDIDLAGVLASPLGTSFAAVELAGIVIVNKPLDPSAAANTTNLTLGGGSNPVLGLFSTMILRPGAMVSALAGDPGGLCVITPGTGDILRVANSAGATAKYLIAALGRTA